MYRIALYANKFVVDKKGTIKLEYFLENTKKRVHFLKKFHTYNKLVGRVDWTSGI